MPFGTGCGATESFASDFLGDGCRAATGVASDFRLEEKRRGNCTLFIILNLRNEIYLT